MIPDFCWRERQIDIWKINIRQILRYLSVVYVKQTVIVYVFVYTSICTYDCFLNHKFRISGRHKYRERVYYLFPIKKPRSNNTQVAVNTHSTQILVSKYHNFNKRSQGSLLREMADSRTRVGELQNYSRIFCCIREKE